MHLQGSPTVAVVGVGGIGGFIGGELACRTDADVMLCSRRSFDVLEVERDGAVERASRAQVVVHPSEVVAPVDWILLATKAHQVDAAAPWLDALWGPSTRVAVLQNGVEHLERVRRWTRGDEVLPVVVRTGAEALAPGRVVVSVLNTWTVPAGELADEFAALLRGTAVDLIRSDTFPVDLWTKLGWNVGVNPLTAITGLPGHRIGRDRDLAALVRVLIVETTAVAAAAGIELDPALPETVVRALHDQVVDVRSSMAQDRVRGRSLEHEALTGAVLRHARRHGIAVPVTETVHRLLAGISVSDAP